MILDSLIELASAEDLNEACWPTRLSNGYSVPSSEGIKGLWPMVALRDDYQNLTNDEKQGLHRIIETVESSKSQIGSKPISPQCTMASCGCAGVVQQIKEGQVLWIILNLRSFQKIGILKM